MQSYNKEKPTSSASDHQNKKMPQILRVRAPPGDNSCLLLRLANGTMIMTDSLYITTKPLIIVTHRPEPDSNIPCIHLVSTEADTDDHAEAGLNTEAENDSFTNLVTLSERPVTYDLAVNCPLAKCTKFGPVNDLNNHYIRAHANHDYASDSDEE